MSSALQHIRTHRSGPLSKDDTEAIEAAHAKGKRKAVGGHDAYVPAISREEEIDSVVKMCVAGALPFNIVNNIGFRAYQELHGGPRVPYTSVRRSFWGTYKAMVEDPTAEKIDSLLAPVSVTLTAQRFTPSCRPPSTAGKRSRVSSLRALPWVVG